MNLSRWFYVVLIFLSLALFACDSTGRTWLSEEEVTATAAKQPTVTAQPPPNENEVADERNEEGLVLRWRTDPYNQAEIDLYHGINSLLNEEMNGVQLVYEPSDKSRYSYQDGLKREIAVGGGADLFWLPDSDVGDFASRGMILDLQPFAIQDPGYQEADFHEGPMSHLTYNPHSGQSGGVLWGLPRDVSTYVLYLNVDLIKKAGAPDPRRLAAEGKWDWNTFMQVADKVNKLGDEVRGYGQAASWQAYGYWMYAAGGSFYDQSGTGCGLNSPQALNGLGFQQAVYQNFDVAVPYGEDPASPFLAGNLGMLLESRGATKAFRHSDLPFVWDVVKLPDGPAGPSNWVFWGGYVVNRNTEHPALAYTLLRSLTRADVQLAISAADSKIPSRMTEEVINTFLTFTPPYNNLAYYQALSENAHSPLPLWHGSWRQYVGVMNMGISGVLRGQQSVEEHGAGICDVGGQAFY